MENSKKVKFRHMSEDEFEQKYANAYSDYNDVKDKTYTFGEIEVPEEVEETGASLHKGGWTACELTYERTPHRFFTDDYGWAWVPDVEFEKVES